MTYSTDLQVRFRDIDAMGHVNNAVYATYLEQVRTDFFADVLSENLADVPTVLARLELSYERPITLGQSLTATVDVPRLGESSLPMEYEVLADGERAATGKSIQVFIDPDTGGSRPIPERVRKRIAEYEGLDL
ncbi:acyl-CoA thioesterase [Halalkalicoccus salilacus]|uniref:acyl-CoA thioesterase n=1 Tax=Halalkalicoccus TaxID=332246 RepID=UPI002F9673B4